MKVVNVVARNVTAIEKVNEKAVKKLTAQIRDHRTDVLDAELWEHAHANQLGVIAWDPVGHKIGMNVCTGDAAKNYFPVDRYKQTLVGKCLRYGRYDGSWPNEDEFDWNIFVNPDAGYQFILDDVVALMSQADQEELQTVGTTRVVECEITPDETFYDNTYFPITGPVRSPVLGKSIGVYGPWVRDGGHKGRPEIHPCEIVWWCERVRRRNRWTFLIVQDDSNRYDLKTDYQGTQPHPWSAPPRRAAFSVALELGGGLSHNYRLSLHRHRNMSVFGGKLQSDDPADYRLEKSLTAGRASGRRPIRPASGSIAIPPVPPLVEVGVEKAVEEDRDIGKGDTANAVRDRRGEQSIDIPAVSDKRSPGMLDASLSRIVPDPAGGDRYRCFLHFQVQVGINSNGREGYAEITLDELPADRLGPQFQRKPR